MPQAKYAETQRKWLDKNPEYVKEDYEKNKRKNWDASNKRRRFLTEAKRFRNILLEFAIYISENDED